MATSAFLQQFQTDEAKSQYVSAVAGSALVFASAFVLNAMRRPKEFTTDEGKRIAELPADVRMSKFVRSRELSEQGEALAGTEPYLIRSGPYHELVISQPDQVHEFYRSDSKSHTKPRNLNLGEPFGRFLGPCVGVQYGDHWRAIRKHFDPPFAFHPSYWTLLELNDQHDAIMMDMLVSKHPDSKLYNLLPSAPRKRLQEFHSRWQEFNRLIVENARVGGWACPVETIYRGVEPDKDFTEDAFLATLTEILFANVNISAEVFRTIFTNLATSPRIQTSLRQEIREWKAKPDFDLSKYLAKQDTLLNRVLMESMRISPAFWFSMPETTAEPKKISGYNIPAGTPVVIDTRRLNNGAATWGLTGVDRFDPDRFLKVASQDLRCGFMRFGTGAASGRCLGKNVADAVFKLTVMEVLERFRLESVSESAKEGRSVDVRLVALK
ncbi:putative monooxygenase [Aspergillus brunneoviolaceus CBS 621.78]|uniref:Monooxygenase n=1 Tax=Aspergillus brunneoviolaceus CBS 621.78 TaxID=1450534 RepID=A0ACD1FS01_9EURO|nr:putative monooxygenase [Aspergillus brunneoviolaceus CBS 621.78]RAH39744.1 putative monooxygenase [Aspergillus brunneoviolaceus CBS 621.78]